MNVSRLVRVVWGALLLGYAAVPLAAQTAPAPPATPIKATVEQLAWVTGAWTATLGDRTVEQHWMAPVGHTIVAMFRSIRNDQAQLYELLAIEQEGDGVVLRIKHFAPGPGLVGREGKDESVNHVLVSVDGRSAVFQGTGADNPPRVSFTSPDPQTLTIVVTRLRDGAPASTDFQYKRLAH